MDKTEIPTKDELNQIREEYKAPIIIDDKNKGADDKSKVIPVAEDKNKGAAATQEEPKGKVDVQAVEEKPITLASLSDDEVIAELEKRGKKIATETLTDEQKKRQSEIEEAEKRKYAIDNLNMTNEQYDEIKNIIAADGTELTKKEFTKLFKSENKTATKEEVDAAYNDYYNLPQTVIEKSKRVKRDEKGKVVFKDDDPEEIVEEEVDIPKSKFDEKLSKFGEQRIQNDAQRTKEVAKQAQKYIDDSFANNKAVIAKANEYAKVAEKVLSEIDFNALPVNYKFGEKGKEKEIKAIVKLDDTAKAEVENYINTDLAKLIINTDKFNDKEEISKQINKYVKDRYDNQVGESLYNLGQSAGINIGKIGGTAPHVVITGTGEDQIVSELEKSVNERLPDNPLHNK